MAAVDTLYKTLNKDKTFGDTELKKAVYGRVKKAIDYWKDLIKKAKADIKKAKQEADAAAAQADAVKQNINIGLNLNYDASTPVNENRQIILNNGRSRYYQGKILPTHIGKGNPISQRRGGATGGPPNRHKPAAGSYWKDINLKNVASGNAITHDIVKTWFEIYQKEESGNMNLYFKVNSISIFIII